ncbi:inositol-tetrakisphosphate 1-kinase-like isoform X2 [Corythoichthys intestinalis]|uniref:inositol-tetrakisphosphate 1-kinase-like isoform X2 n=1 Tax=Corythoichthys intestinalis TaxID=161448 RepID=UPI0025A61199|nr:inositol-tetrakisphosphate 1-kinase-like isoform X2 [Corythoichthys intestinalis]
MTVFLQYLRINVCLSCITIKQLQNRIRTNSFCSYREHGVEVVEIDLTQPLEPQGPFDVIVHKLSDVIVEAEHDSQSKQLLVNFQSYVSAHTRTVLLDPIPAMSQILDRFSSYRIMGKLHNSLRDWHICSPPYVEVHSASDMPFIQQNVTSQNLSFPLICKTRVAHGSLSHEMSLIFSAASLAEIHPPCVLQSFVNHGAVLHKVFVIGEKHFCVERPSLKNFPSGPCERETIFFNSQQVSKPESSCDLTALDEQMSCMPPPSSEAVAALVRELRVQLGMALFGVDVIINIHTYTLTVIDINVFPGYEGVPQFFTSLLSHIESVLDKQASVGSNETAKVKGVTSTDASGL